MSIQDLPRELVAQAASTMLLLSGTEGIVNHKDLPFLMKSIANLSLVNKFFQRVIEDHTDLFIETLAKKYNSPPEHIATLMDSPASRRWLWQQIQKNGDREIYTTIQTIYQITEKILKQVRASHPRLQISLGNTTWTDPNPYFLRTQAGFYLQKNQVDFLLASPFGEMHLTNTSSFDKNPSPAIEQQLVKQLKVVVKDGLSIITQVKDSPTPEVQRISGRDARTDESIQATWKMLERERKGANVFGRLRSPARKQEPQLANFRHVAELADWISETIERLKQQPQMQVKLFTDKITILALPLETRRQAHILSYLKRPDPGSPIDVYDSETFPNVAGNGIYIQTPYNERDLLSLKDDTRLVLQNLAFNERNWSRANLKDYYSQILHAESEETHLLFISRSPHWALKANFFRLIANEIGLGAACNCHELQDGGSAFLSTPKPIPLYLWVKKEDLEKVKRAFAGY